MKSTVRKSISNTFRQSIIIGIDDSFHKYSGASIPPRAMTQPSPSPSFPLPFPPPLSLFPSPSLPLEVGPLKFG